MPQISYTVDHKRDCFTTTIVSRRDPFGEVKSHIATYVLWMEHEYHCGSTSHRNRSLRDDWYLRRLSWLHRLIRVLEMSTEEIAEQMRKLSLSVMESQHESINVEEGIGHFLLSWAKWDQLPRVEQNRSSYHTK